MSDRFFADFCKQFLFSAQLVFGPTRLQVSVERYFFWKYRIRLTRPNWPLVFLRGNSSNQFPIELIELICKFFILLVNVKVLVFQEPTPPPLYISPHPATLHFATPPHPRHISPLFFNFFSINFYVERSNIE